MSRTIRDLPRANRWFCKWYRSPRHIGYRRQSVSDQDGYRLSNRDKAVMSRTVDNWDDIPIAATYERVEK